VDLGLGPSQTQLPSPVAKKGRTNTPWTPAEEQRLKTLREAGSSWSEIAKTFPTRTEGSVKKHWYKVRLPTSSHCACARCCAVSLTLLAGYALRGVCGRRGQQFRSPHRDQEDVDIQADVSTECGLVAGHQRLRKQQVEGDRTEGWQAGKGTYLFGVVLALMCDWTSSCAPAACWPASSMARMLGQANRFGSARACSSHPMLYLRKYRTFFRS